MLLLWIGGTSANKIAYSIRVQVGLISSCCNYFSKILSQSE